MSIILKTYVGPIIELGKDLKINGVAFDFNFFQIDEKHKKLQKLSEFFMNITDSNDYTYKPVFVVRPHEDSDKVIINTSRVYTKQGNGFVDFDLEEMSIKKKAFEEDLEYQTIIDGLYKVFGKKSVKVYYGLTQYYA